MKIKSLKVNNLDDPKHPTAKFVIYWCNHCICQNNIYIHLVDNKWYWWGYIKVDKGMYGGTECINDLLDSLNRMHEQEVSKFIDE